MKIYFAHPVSDYNTPKELSDIARIQAEFPTATILNPNSPESEEAYKTQGMAFFRNLAATCDVLVAVPFSDGEWGMGVWAEAETMQRKGGAVWLLHEGTFKQVNVEDIRPLSITESRNRLKEWRRLRGIAA